MVESLEYTIIHLFIFNCSSGVGWQKPTFRRKNPFPSKTTPGGFPGREDTYSIQ